MSLPTRDVALQALFAPVDVRVFSSTVNADLIAELHDQEAPALATMADRRQAEFATARACARAAMADLGVHSGIPRRDGGAPLWPESITGSISHTRGFCVAAASTAGRAIGLDVEEIGRMKPAVERRILVEPEKDLAQGLDDDDRRQYVATIFAAKEAFYKAHYEVDARYLGFDAVHVTISDTNLQFGPASGAVAANLLSSTTGRVRVDQGRVIVAVMIDAASGPSPLPSPA